MRYKIRALFILVILMTFSALTQPFMTNADCNISIIIADKDCLFYYLESDVAPVLKDGITLVPLRAIAEVFNFDVVWNNSNQSIRISKEDKEIELVIGKIEAVVNGEIIKLPVAPQILNNRTIVPVRYVSEFFGINVVWEQGIEDNAFIWLSDLSLLSEKDVIPNDNYYMLWEDPVPYYALKADGATSRNIKIGDEYAKVIEQYGAPHKIYGGDGESIEYYTPFLPNTDSGSALLFKFKNGNVKSVELDV